MEKKEQTKEELQKELDEARKRIHETYSRLPLYYANKNNLVEHKNWDTSKRSKTSTTSFTQFSKEQLLTWLKSPESNSANIINASCYFYNTSAQYRRLISYFAGMLTWDYTLSPTKIDPDNIKTDNLLKKYKSTTNTVENMNLKHELKKAATIALKEDVFFGVEESTKDSFSITKINPEYCTLDSLIDGCYSFSIDMSKIKEEELVLYPQILQKMYQDYVSSGQNYQKVPTEYCWCLKFDETTDYPMPPFAATLPDLCDIDTYKELQIAKTEIQNYKALSAKIALDSDGMPILEWDTVLQYCAQIDAVLPDYIGLFATPFDIKSFEFENSGGLNEVDTVARANEYFWNSTGTSALLFGDAKNNTAGALNLSITADEEIMFMFMEQCQRLVNRRLKCLSGTPDFKITFLPMTVFNRKTVQESYSKAVTYGYPVKRAAVATMGLTPDDFIAQTYLENQVLQLQNEFIPVQTSHTQSNDPGRPSTNEDNIEGTTEDDSSNITNKEEG